MRARAMREQTGQDRGRAALFARLSHVAGAVLLGVLLALAPHAGLAQTDGTVPLAPQQTQTAPREGQARAGAGEPTLLAAEGVTAPSSLDYAAWEAAATRAEVAIEDRSATDVTLEVLRAQVADWREALLGAQSANSARIATLREQIAALGPAPEEGQTEAGEIATRRGELTEQLVRLQAPGIAAEEAYRRADGLVREIDRVLRDRQADELLRLWPAPVNPANWPEAFGALSGTAVTLWSETRAQWQMPDARQSLVDNLPLILLYLGFAVGLLTQGRKLIERWTLHLMHVSSGRGRQVLALVVSLGQIVIPVLGTLALVRALQLSSMTGIVGSVIVQALPAISLTIFAATWLGGRIFAKGNASHTLLRLPPERRAEGRLLVTSYGLLLGVEGLRLAAMDQLAASDAATAVLTFPILCIGGVLLFRMGQLLRHSSVDVIETDDGPNYRLSLVRLIGRAAMVVGVVGPVLAAVGYVSAAGALVYPAALSISLVGLLFMLQSFVGDLHALVTRKDDAGRKALIPVLIGFGLSIAALPLFALIWGARTSDITEMWARLREGFQLGETRVSPTDFLFFVAVFGLGYLLTRLVQGALKSSILPRTSLDQGGQNAIVSGVGYVGILLAGLIAINWAGIDLSGLAIVAGALSLGIGFGLQNIVSNFVSGIILLIERPVSEGDWIEVGGVQGTVKTISVRSTRIQTFDRTDVIVPNSDLVSGQVTNWTRFNLSGRLIVPIGVAFGSDTRKVAQVLSEIAEAQPLAILNPPPLIIFMGFGADSMNFEIRMILRDINFSLSVRTEINHSIVARFAEEGIEIPFAQSEVSLRNVEEIALALQRVFGPGRQPVLATQALPGATVGPVSGPAEAREPAANQIETGDPAFDPDQARDLEDRR